MLVEDIGTNSGVWKYAKYASMQVCKYAKMLAFAMWCYVLCAMCYVIVLCAMCYFLCAMCYVLFHMCYVLCAPKVGELLSILHNTVKLLYVCSCGIFIRLRLILGLRLAYIYV